ncbi:hypothetical protein SAMN02799624_01040 [Paenibacillus sp. UNC496MF]|nr:hypothetical protein SAMN02799624_01040 [Paenibacillus sp. UNC496MF]
MRIMPIAQQRRSAAAGPTCGSSSENGAVPATEIQIIVLRPKRSASGPPSSVPAMPANCSAKRQICAVERQMVALHEVERIEVRHAGDVDEFGEKQGDQQRHRAGDEQPGMRRARRGVQDRGDGLLRRRGRGQLPLVPAADDGLDRDAEDGRDGEPEEAALPERQQHEADEQRRERPAGVAADLEDRLRHAPAAPRRHPGDAGDSGWRTEAPAPIRAAAASSSPRYPRTRSRACRAAKTPCRAAGGPASAGGRTSSRRAAAARGGNVEHERYPADLGEREPHRGLEERKRGRHGGLHRVVQQVREADAAASGSLDSRVGAKSGTRYRTCGRQPACGPNQRAALTPAASRPRGTRPAARLCAVGRTPPRRTPGSAGRVPRERSRRCRTRRPRPRGRIRRTRGRRSR